MPVTMFTTPGGRPASAKRRCELEHRERRLLGGLQHDRAAGADRRRQLPRRHQQRVVPRHDLPGDADRLAQREADARCRAPAGRRRESSSRGRRSTRSRSRRRRCRTPTSTIGLPLLRVSISASSSARSRTICGELEEHASAILRGGVLPRALVERRARRLHGAIDVRGGRVGHRRDDFGRGGIDHVDRGGRLRGATNSPLM